MLLSRRRVRVRVLEARFHPATRSHPMSVVVGRVICDGRRARIEPVAVAPSAVKPFDSARLHEKLEFLASLDSSDPENVERRDKACAVVRDAAETVHEILTAGKDAPKPATSAIDRIIAVVEGKDAPNSATHAVNHIIVVLHKAMLALINLLKEAADAETARRLILFLEHQRVAGQDAANRHEVLG